MPWTKFGSILGPQGLQGEVSVDPNTVTGAASTPAIVEDLDARPTHAQLRFTIPQGIQGVQGVQGEVAVDSTVTGAAGSQALVEDLDPSPNKALLKFTIPRGNTGATGNTGPQGEVSVVGTNTISPGSQASVVDQDGRPTHAALLFNIPAGIQGVQGIQGEVAVATTETLPPGTPAFVNDSEASPNRAVLHFGIPQGLKGDKGDIGPQGPGGVPSGPAGGDLAGTYPDPTLAVDRVRKTGDTMTGNLTMAELVQIILATPGSAAKGRLHTLPGTPDWLGYTLNCEYTPSGWVLDDAAKQGWFFKLDSRAASSEFAVYCIPAGANPHTDEFPVLRANATQLTVPGMLYAANNINLPGGGILWTAADYFLYIKDGWLSVASGSGVLKPIQVGEPTSGSHAITMSYANWLVGGYVAKGGDTMTGDLVVNKTGGSSSITLQSTSGNSYLKARSAVGTQAGLQIVDNASGNARWVVGKTTANESGSNNGSHLAITSYSDSGAFIGTALLIDRPTAMCTVKADPTAPLGIATKQWVEARVMYGTAAPPAQVAPAGTIYCQYT